MAVEEFGVQVTVASAIPGADLSAQLQSAVDAASKNLHVTIKNVDGGDKVGTALGKDITAGMAKSLDAGKAFESIVKSVNKVGDAFAPLNKALTTEGTAFNRMATEGGASLDGLLSKLEELQSLIQSIDSKSLGVNIFAKNGTNSNSSGQIAAYKQSLQELIPQLQQASTAIGALFSQGTRGLDYSAVNDAMNSMMKMGSALNSLTGATDKAGLTKAATQLQIIYNSYKRLVDLSGKGDALNFPTITFPDYASFSVDPVDKLLQGMASANEEVKSTATGADEQIGKIISTLNSLYDSLGRIETQLTSLAGALDLNIIADQISRIADSFSTSADSISKKADQINQSINKTDSGADVSALKERASAINKVIAAYKEYATAQRKYGTAEAKGTGSEELNLLSQQLSDAKNQAEQMTLSLGTLSASESEQISKAQALVSTVQNLQAARQADISAIQSESEANQRATESLQAEKKIVSDFQRSVNSYQKNTQTGQLFDSAKLETYRAALKNLSDAYDKLFTAQKSGSDFDIGVAQAEFNTAVQSINEIKTSLDSEVSSVKAAEAALQNLGKVEATMQTTSKGMFNTDNLGKYRQDIEEALTAVQRMDAAGDGDGLKSAYVNLDKARVAAENYTKSLNRSSVSIDRMNSFIRQMTNYLSQNTNLSANNVAGIKKIIATVEEMKTAENMDPTLFNEQVRGFSEIQLAAQRAGETGSTAIQKLATRLQTLFTTRFASQAFVYLQRAFKEILDAVIAIDDAMTQLEIVTGASGSEMTTFFDEAANSARQLGASVSDILDSIQTFSRLGYQLSDALDLSEAATVLSNVADTTVDEATTGLTSIIKGFDIDASDAMGVADILTEVGQKYAVSAAELMTALENGGSSLQAANNTLEEAVALIAAGNASVQDSAKVGTALKTISATVRSATAELEELGEYEEGVTKSSADLRNELLQLTGVDIMVDAETFKSTYQIIKELAEVWDQISDVDQAVVLEDLAGKRNTNVVLSMIQNIDDLTGAYEAAGNAAGVAETANNIYLDSITGKLGQLQAASQVLSNDLLDSGLVKGAVDTGTTFLNLIDSLVNSIGALGTVAGGAGVIAFFKNLD